MKYFGKIEDNNDLVNKKYVDDNSGGPVYDGKLKVDNDSGSSIELFSANQNGNKILNFKGTSGITVTKTTNNSLGGDDKVDITISSRSSTPNNAKLKLGIDLENPIEVFSANASTDSTVTFKSGAGITLTQSNNDITITSTSGDPGNGKLSVQVNGSNSTDIFTANQATKDDSVLNFIGTSGITITKTTDISGRTANITISGSGSGSSSNNSHHTESINTTTTSSLSLPTIYKNLVVKFMYNGISTPSSSGNGISYVLNFAGSGLNEGDEMYIYLRNASDTAGVNIKVPHSLTFSNGGLGTNAVYPVIYNGFYTDSTSALYDNETINLQYNNNFDGNHSVYTSLVLHVFFDGEVYYINKLEYTIPKGPVS